MNPRQPRASSHLSNWLSASGEIIQAHSPQTRSSLEDIPLLSHHFASFEVPLHTSWHVPMFHLEFNIPAILTTCCISVPWCFHPQSVNPVVRHKLLDVNLAALRGRGSMYVHRQGGRHFVAGKSCHVSQNWKMLKSYGHTSKFSKSSSRATAWDIYLRWCLVVGMSHIMSCFFFVTPFIIFLASKEKVKQWTNRNISRFFYEGAALGGPSWCTSPSNWCVGGMNKLWIFILKFASDLSNK